MKINFSKSKFQYSHFGGEMHNLSLVQPYLQPGIQNINYLDPLIQVIECSNPTLFLPYYQSFIIKVSWFYTYI